MRKTTILTAFVFIALLAFFVNAGVYETPASGSRISGLNYQIILNTTLSNHSTCQFNASTISSPINTANGTIQILQNVSNSTIVQTRWNLTFNTSDFEDGNYSVIVTCTNTSAGFVNTIERTTQSSVAFDNTVPSTPTGLTEGTLNSFDVRVSSTVTGSSTTFCIFRWDGDNAPPVTPTAIHSGNTCSANTTVQNNGQYLYTFNASDGTNISSSASSWIGVSPASTGGGGGGGGVTPVRIVETTKESQDTTSASAPSEGKAGGFFNSIVQFFKNLFSQMKE